MHKCESCGMPTDVGLYCQYCVDENGQLQDFETRFARMKEWQEKNGSAPQDAARETLEYMSTMPAWRDNPVLIKLLKN